MIGYFICFCFDFSHLLAFIALNQFRAIPIGYGLMFGFTYAFIPMLFMQAPIFDTLDNRLENLFKHLKLTVTKGILLSICAGVGEELFFRAALQPYLGIWITSIFFVAIHGYLNPWNWKFSLYGLLILPFVVLLSYGFEHFGLWFAISAHFAYDAVLFTFLVDQHSKNS